MRQPVNLRLHTSAASRRLRAYIRYSLKLGGVQNIKQTETILLHRISPPIFFVLDHIGLQVDDTQHPTMVIINEFEVVGRLLHHDPHVDVTPLVQLALVNLSDPILENAVALIRRLERRTQSHN
jgi:hypothetical protein